VITRLGEVRKITHKLPPPSSTERLAAVRMHGCQALGKWVQRHAAAPRAVEAQRERSLTARTVVNPFYFTG